MAKEIIDEVKKTEEEAASYLEKAKETARQILTDAKTKAEEKYQSLLLEAEEEANILKDNAEREAREKMKPVIEKGKGDAQKILAMDESMIDSAACAVMERIIK